MKLAEIAVHMPMDRRLQEIDARPSPLVYFLGQSVPDETLGDHFDGVLAVG